MCEHIEIHSITYGKKEIEFELERKDVKNINLNVRPDMSVAVSASAEVPLEFIEDFVREKAPWIVRNVNYFKRVQPEVKREKEFVSGETVRYLGKQYRLKIEASDREYVKFLRGFIYIYVKDVDNYKKKRRLFEEWMRYRAEIIFRDSLDRMYPLVRKYGVEKPSLNIREMRARWGSYIRKSNTIILNLELIKAPKYCIDYVVLHELLHFIYKNHDQKFYDFLSVLMPDWQERKKILDEEIIRVL